MSKTVLLVVVPVCLFGLIEAGTRDKTPPPQLVVTKAVADLEILPPTLLIHGVNFGPDPAVFWGKELGALDQLTVFPISDNLIEAELPTTDPATYLMLVRSGPAATQVFAMDVTIGVAGPPGTQTPALVMVDSQDQEIGLVVSEHGGPGPIRSGSVSGQGAVVATEIGGDIILLAVSAFSIRGRFQGFDAGLGQGAVSFTDSSCTTAYIRVNPPGDRFISPVTAVEAPGITLYVAD